MYHGDAKEKAKEISTNNVLNKRLFISAQLRGEARGKLSVIFPL